VSVATSSTTAIRAVAIDVAGNSSGCSAALEYTQSAPGPTGETGKTGAKEIKPVIQNLVVPRCATGVRGKKAPAIAFKIRSAARVKLAERRRVSPLLALPAHCPRTIATPSKSTKFKTVKSRNIGTLKPGRYRINLTRELRGLVPGFYDFVLTTTPDGSKATERNEFYLWKLG
jgi:hypothetical protein